MIKYPKSWLCFLNFKPSFTEYFLPRFPSLPCVGADAVGGHLVLGHHLERGRHRLLRFAVVATLVVRTLLHGELMQLLAQLEWAAGAPLDRFQPPLSVQGGPSGNGLFFVDTRLKVALKLGRK